MRSYLLIGLVFLGLALAALAIAPFAWNEYLIAAKRQHDYQQQLAVEQGEKAYQQQLQAQKEAQASQAFRMALERAEDQTARDYLANPEAYLDKLEMELKNQPPNAYLDKFNSRHVFTAVPLQ